MKEQKILIARQPIFTAGIKLFGYELLYRDESDHGEFNPQMDGARATCEVLSRSIVTFGMKKLTKGTLAFINFPRSLLLSHLPELLSPREIVIEVLEDTHADQPVLDRLDVLRAQGFIMALDDYDGSPQFDQIIDHVDMLKVDFRLTTPQERTRIAQRYGGKVRLLAEKVETKEEFEQAKRDGYELFQGYYFSKPIVLSQNAGDIMSVTYLRLWREVGKEDANFARLAEIIENDVNLTYKFLRRINTLEFYQGHRVTSIRHAVVRMGCCELRRWLLLLLMRDVVGNKLNESVRTALVRGVFAEQMASLIGREDLTEDAYIVGLFSMIPVILGKDMQEALNGLKLSRSIRAALGGRTGVLYEMLEFTKAYEAGDWGAVSNYLQKQSLTQRQVLSAYTEAVRYADLAFSDTSE